MRRGTHSRPAQARARGPAYIYDTHKERGRRRLSARRGRVQGWPTGFAAGASSKSGRGDLWACVARVGAARGDGEVCGPVGDLGGTSRHKGSTL